MLSLTIKCFLFISANIFFSKSVHADTSKFYFKNLDNGVTGEVDDPKYADFYRLVITPDSADKDFIVKEFYKNGRPKFVGQYKRGFSIATDGKGTLEGTCTTFYANGQKQTSVNYSVGVKYGGDTAYFPNGRLYTITRNVNAINAYAQYKERCIACYDINGNALCVNGNGSWLVYDDSFASILLQGPIKNGLRDGKWKGQTGSADSIKFVCDYKSGAFLQGKSFDKSGKVYSFTEEADPPRCKLNMVDYLDVLYSRMKLPKYERGKKSLFEDFKLSFVIEADGQLSHIEAIGTTDSIFTESLKSAVLKTGNWNPRKYYGIPMRSQITVPLQYDGKFVGDNYVREV
jgi:antitoxin component YwqK of YwqJK toxin-antitoxin module